MRPFSLSPQPASDNNIPFFRHPPGGFQATVLNYEVLTRDNLILDQFSDSYIFIYSYIGRAKAHIDFNEYEVSHGNALVITPKQVFRCENPSRDAVALALVIGQGCLSNEMKDPLAYLTIDASPFKVTDSQGHEIVTLFEMLQARHNEEGVDCFGADAMIARAYAAVILEALNARNNAMSHEKQSCLPLLMRLSRLFETDLHISRLPSHYAKKLDISATYLNEKIKNALGINISLLIRRESILEACRLLAMTSMNVKDIAQATGYDDPAYFTRLFTKMVGHTPSTFRSVISSLK